MKTWSIGERGIKVLEHAVGEPPDHEPVDAEAGQLVDAPSCSHLKTVPARPGREARRAAASARSPPRDSACLPRAAANGRRTARSRGRRGGPRRGHAPRRASPPPRVAPEVEAGLLGGLADGRRLEVRVLALGAPPGNPMCPDQGSRSCSARRISSSSIRRTALPQHDRHGSSRARAGPRAPLVAASARGAASHPGAFTAGAVHPGQRQQRARVSEPQIGHVGREPARHQSASTSAGEA